MHLMKAPPVAPSGSRGVSARAITLLPGTLSLGKLKMVGRIDFPLGIIGENGHKKTSKAMNDE
jgi:hypothetical protein